MERDVITLEVLSRLNSIRRLFNQIPAAEVEKIRIKIATVADEVAEKNRSIEVIKDNLRENGLTVNDLIK